MVAWEAAGAAWEAAGVAWVATAWDIQAWAAGVAWVATVWVAWDIRACMVAAWEAAGAAWAAMAWDIQAGDGEEVMEDGAVADGDHLLINRFDLNSTFKTGIITEFE